MAGEERHLFFEELFQLCQQHWQLAADDSPGDFVIHLLIPVYDLISEGDDSPRLRYPLGQSGFELAQLAQCLSHMTN
jgi:hypothetical protein